MDQTAPNPQGFETGGALEEGDYSQTEQTCICLDLDWSACVVYICEHKSIREK